MTKTAIAIPDDDFESLGVSGTSRLVAELMENVAANLVRIGKAIRYLDSQGFDVVPFENAFGRSDLRAIADGLMEPAVWLKLEKHRKVLRAVCQLPRAVQLELVGGKPLEVAVRRPDGTQDVQKIAVENLNHELVDQVFCGPYIRSIPEQVALSIDPFVKPVLAINEAVDKASLVDGLKWAIGEYEQAPSKRHEKKAAAKIVDLAGKVDLLVR